METKRDYVDVALDMLLNIIGDDDMRMMSTILTSKTIYANTKKVAHRATVDQLFDEVIDIFSKAKELMKEKEDFSDESKDNA